jgi:predicted PhzF superfamily epimerase YddE/YHI9
VHYPIYQVDAFTSRRYHGNPAAVVITDRWLPVATMHAVAAENNLAETAFIVPEAERFAIRWFTPTVEIDLCGHATLASAHVLLSHGYTDRNPIEFSYGGGLLHVSRDGERLALDFPSRPPLAAASLAHEVGAALGATPRETHSAKAILAVFDTVEQVLGLRPSMDLISKLPCYGLIATAPGSDCDFVSRFFAPQSGVPEDPVTGSAHCTLIPYWSRRLGKTHLYARQVSPRGGELWCEDRGERVTIAGHAADYLIGKITV